ncbi:hypothetical protein ACIPYS_15775 [Kitasatospora sp. NPDC089913]|uniref:hypothetical protein n=1 Tax=Kitasatospora sp. NPDC089913 TaxID=3364080 RepID=UPI0038071D68
MWTDSGNGILSRWYDEQTNDGSYVERGAIRTCLTNYNDLVYTEPCDGDASANASNWYQRWYEISTPTGWKLQNRMTGRILDSNEYGQVYTLGDFGDSDLNQRWE